MEVKTLVLGALASNCYLVTLADGGCVAVDIGDGAATVLRYLKQYEKTLRAILLTHGHYDHIAGVEAVRKACDVPVYIHTLDAPMLTDSAANLATWLSDTPFESVQQFQTVEDGDTITIGGTEFTVLHTPGHTPGSVCWICGDVMLTGDTLFHLSRGRTDFPGGSDAEMLRSFRRLASIEGDYRVLPGHNEETTLSFEKAHNPTMRGL